MIYDDDSMNLDGFESIVRRTTKALREHIDEFDSIAVSGMSGVLVGAPVSLRLQKPLVVIRKPHEASHAQHTYGNDTHINMERVGARALFLDDFVYRGETRDRVIDAVEQQNARLVAQYLYTDDVYTVWSPRQHTVASNWSASVEEPGALMPF